MPVPTATDNVIIPNLDNDPIIGASTAVANSVDVEIGAVLTIQSTASLTVSGASVIHDWNTSFYNLGTVDNSGELVIADQQGAGRVGLFNEAIFNNNSGGEIKIDNARDYFLYNRTEGVFTNAASIIIGATGSQGSKGLLNEATFTNNTGGVIQIDRSSSVALDNAGRFTNAAGIIIGATAPTGGVWQGLLNRATFNNNTGGAIQIARAYFAGLYNSQGPSPIRPASSSGLRVLRDSMVF
jgi:hypothetical protein